MSTHSHDTFYSDRPHILVIDDDAQLRDLLCSYLQESDFIVVGVDSADAATRVVTGLCIRPAGG